MMDWTTYQLEIDVPHPVAVQVGKLGRFVFPAGKFVYTGSARRNIDARISRHLSREKKLRWHIDYLLHAGGVSVVRVRRSRLNECQLNRRTGGTVLVPGFGASDCRSGCGSHLRYLGK